MAQRVHWGIRWGAFALSTITLSLFFGGWRDINTTEGIFGYVELAAGVVLTFILLFFQGYWIYFEEKNKGTLRREQKWFDALHRFLSKHDNKFVRLIQPAVVVKEEGVNK